MIIRAAHVSDSAAIARIWNHYITQTTVTFNPDPKSADEVAALIHDRQARGWGMFVALGAAGAITGFAGYGQFRAGAGYGRTMEHTVLLDPTATGRGAGRALMAMVAAHARDGGAHSLIAGVSGENAAGLRFHAAIGFAEIARLPQVGYKFARFLDLVLMQKILT